MIPPCLVALTAVPHFASTCAEHKCLKELRSMCKQGRFASKGLITGLSIDCKQPFPGPKSAAGKLASLSSVLHTCRLRRFCVVLHLENYGRFKSDLMRIASGLRRFLSTVTELTIQLTGEEPSNITNTIINASSLTVGILGSVCSPLTRIKVASEVQAVGQNSYTPLLDAASSVCATSLTHLVFIIQARYPARILALPECVDDPEFVMMVGCDFHLDDDACDALSSLTSLTHLELENCTVSDEDTWAALPPSLWYLEIRAPACRLPDGLFLPNLQHLRVKESSCSMLLQLLQACPQTCKLALDLLITPETEDENTDFQEALKHPVWLASNRGISDDPYCTPVGQVERLVTLESDHPGYLAPWDVLSALPTMPAVTVFHFDFTDLDKDRLVCENPVRVLHHISRAFPNLECLLLDGVMPLDSDLTQLYGCASLSQMKLMNCPDVTGQAVLELAAALPNLFLLQVTDCDLISEEQLEMIESLIESRSSLIPFGFSRI